MKIIIIGAGIAGLTLGLACEQAGMDVRIYDKAKQLENIGGGILLWPHGLRFLDWLNLSQYLDSFQHKINACNIYGTQGESIFRETCAHVFALLGGGILPINRSELQRALAAGLNTETLHLNKTCTTVTSDETSATVSFTDGTQDSADLIVGADGIYSAVRRSFNKTAELQYTGYCWFGGIIPRESVPTIPADESILHTTLSKMMIIWPTANDKLMWYLPVKMPYSDYDSESDGHKELQLLCAHWHPEIKKIIAAPKSAQSFYLPIFTIPPQSSVTHRRIVLIGDAAHAMGPILGQGASQAIEDAFVLFNCITNIHESIPEVLAYYQSLRLDKYKRLAALENQAAETMITDDPALQADFESQVPHMNLEMMYQELIPLVDEEACLQLAKSAADTVMEAV